MRKLKSVVIKFLAIFFIIVPLAAFAHLFIFPQQTRSILIGCSGFKKYGRLYCNGSKSQDRIDTIKSLIQSASLRVASFWGRKTCDPTFIYCDSEEDFKKYGSSHMVPALTHVKLGAYIIISNEGVDLDIIAHEISHAEFYQRIGFYNWSFKIPTWFDEGLAMQNDYRNYYSEDTLKVKSDNYKNLPSVKLLKTGQQFYGGLPEQVMLNFMAAKHEVKNWYSGGKLEKLTRELNAGKSFEEAFTQ